MPKNLNIIIASLVSSISLSCGVGFGSANNSFDSGGTNAPNGSTNNPAAQNPPIITDPNQICPVAGNNYTGTWSNGSMDITNISALSVSGNLITLFKTPCGEIIPAAVSVQSDGRFSYVRSHITIHGTITATGATGTISNNSNCTTERTWTMNRYSNDARGLIIISKIMPVNATNKVFSSTPAGITDSQMNAVGLFPVGSEVLISVSGGTVTYWGGSTCSATQSCSYFIAPGSNQIQVNIQ